MSLPVLVPLPFDCREPIETVAVSFSYTVKHHEEKLRHLLSIKLLQLQVETFYLRESWL